MAVIFILKQRINLIQSKARRFYVLALILFVSYPCFGQKCTFLINPAPVTTIISPNTCPNIKPGDIICLDTLPFNQILILNLHGEHGNPIIIRNSGRQAIIHSDTASYGISVRNSSHLIISGDGHSLNPYGIAITKVGRGAGISLDQLSTDITVSQVEIANTALAGLVAKTDPDCTFTSLRDAFTMYNIIVKDCYMHDLGMEGIYVGNTFYNGRIINCDNRDTLVYPHVLIGVKVFRNIIERSGRNGLQINSAVSDCHIFDNKILYDSQSETPNQMGGIQLGGGSVCDCYNNRIFYGKGSGIEVFGKGNFMIYNNLIVHPGRSFMPDTAHFYYPKHGIFLKDVNTDPNATIHIFHNTIISPKSDGIRFNNQYLNGSRIQNNIIINPGAYNEIGANAFVHYNDVNLIISHNLLSLEIDEPCFSDHFAEDFTLKSLSSAIDAGIDVSEFGINYDINYDRRPMGAGYDLGAYEMNPDEFDEISPVFRVFPNPFTGHITITFYQQSEGEVALQLYDIKGQRVYDHLVGTIPKGLHRKDFSLELPRRGIYILRFTTTGYCMSKPLIFLK